MDAAFYLIEKGADTQLTDNTGHKAIDYATAHGLREAVIRLSRTETKDARGNTPLHQAVYNGQGEVVRTLLTTSDGMLDATNDNGETPLVIACLKENLRIAKLLIEAGADVNKSLLDGNTPLHYAALWGNRFLGRELIDAKAKVDPSNDQGGTPLLIAARQGNNDFVAMLVENGADVNRADNRQHTALYYAGARGFVEIVEILVAAGAEGN